MAIDDATMNQLLDVATVIGKELFNVISSAITARGEELAALNARLADTLATMRGEKTSAHAAVDASDAALRAELEAMKAAQAKTVTISHRIDPTPPTGDDGQGGNPGSI